MKTKVLLFMCIILLGACTQQKENYPIAEIPVKQETVFEEGIVLGITSETITEDSSNDRTVNGALIGGAASYFLSSRPSATKTLLGAGAGAIIGKTTGGKVKSYTIHTLIIKNLSTNTIDKIETKDINYVKNDTINYNLYENIIYKK